MHWYVIGASPERLVEMRQADHLVDVFDGPLDPDAQTAVFRQIATAAPDGLWITWAALDPPAIDALRRLRVAQPSLDIVIEIPGDLTPPNPDLAQLVALGIYAIVPQSTRFDAATNRAYTFADAAAWQGKVRSFDEPEPEPRERIIEKIVEREVVRETIKKVATTSRPVLISVWGQQPGSGATTLAMAIAAYLSGIAPTVVLDHAPAINQNSFPEQGQTGLHAMAEAMDPIRSLTIQPTQTQGGQVMVPSVRDAMKSHAYAYVVVDAGLGPPADTTVWQDSDCAVLCIPPIFTRWQGIWPWIDRTTQERAHYQAVVLGDQKPCQDDDPDLSCLLIPWPGAPAHAAALTVLLASVLPDDLRPRKRGIHWPRKTRKSKNSQPKSPNVPATPTPKPERRPRQPKRHLTFGDAAWYYLSAVWQIVLLGLVFAIMAAVVWIIGAILPHIPSLAHTAAGQWFQVASHWEGHWFAHVPAPTQRRG